MTKKVPIGGVFSIYMKEIFLFDSFGFERFKEFIIDDDRNILNKILFGIKKSKKKKRYANYVEIFNDRIRKNKKLT